MPPHKVRNHEQRIIVFSHQILIETPTIERPSGMYGKRFHPLKRGYRLATQSKNARVIGTSNTSLSISVLGHVRFAASTNFFFDFLG